jgi:membrane protein involved in colicin uptake
LEAKLKTTTKALEEANNKRAEEVASAKLAADQAVKEVEARAIKAKKPVAEVSQKQSKHEEAIVKCIDDLLTSFGSKCRHAVIFVVLLLSICIPTVYIFVMQQRNLEKLSDYVKAQPKTFF